MRLTQEAASAILDRVTALLPKGVIITDADGVVRASSVSTEVGLLHPLVAAVADRSKRQSFTPAELSHYRGIDEAVLEPITYEGELIGVMLLLGARRDFSTELLGVLQGLAEVVLMQQERIHSLEPKSEIQAAFVERLLTDVSIESMEQVYPEADVLRIDLRRSFAVVYIRAHQLREQFIQARDEGKYSDFDPFINALSRRLAAAVSDESPIVLFRMPDIFIILLPVDHSRLSRRPTIFYKKFVRDVYAKIEEVMDGRVTVGIGGHYPQIEGLRRSYEEARLSCDVGARIKRKGGIYHIYDVGMFVAMTDIDPAQKRSLAEQILEPLISDNELLRTVKSFLDHGMNLTDAAIALHVHRNTLIYRLDKVKDLIALDPRRFDDALQIKLGLMICHVA